MQDTASEGYATSDGDTSSDTEESPPAGGSDDDIDMEDLGGRVRSGKAASTSQTAPLQEELEPAAPREMLTPSLRANLSKQGYKLIGIPLLNGTLVCWAVFMTRAVSGHGCCLLPALSLLALAFALAPETPRQCLLGQAALWDHNTPCKHQHSFKCMYCSLKVNFDTH